ncbi:hypothetical protein [Pseudobutyrivibrio sp.]
MPDMNTQKIEKFSLFKTIVRYTVSGLVTLFTGAIANVVIGKAGGGKLSKAGAYIGCGMLGLMLGDQVGDYICGGIDAIHNNIEDIKAAIDEEG